MVGGRVLIRPKKGTGRVTNVPKQRFVCCGRETSSFLKVAAGPLVVEIGISQSLGTG